METIPQFSRRLAGIVYRDRPSAYGLINDSEGRLLVYRTPSLFMLPGGGVDPGETLEQALERELAEETGFAVTAMPLAYRANQIVKSDEAEGDINKLGSFFLASVGGHAPTDADHETLWLTHAEAVDSLSQEFHRWAADQLGEP